MKRVSLLFLLFIILSSVATAASVWPMLKEIYELNESNANVLWLKQRMQEIGYYSSEDALSSSFDIHLLRKIKSFQYYNHLPVTGRLDSCTVDTIFSDSTQTRAQFMESYAADPSLEPAVTLVFDDTATATKESGNLVFRIKPKNSSSQKDIVAYEFYTVPFNAWDECMVDDVSQYSISVIEKLTPGKVGTAKTVKLENPDQIYQIWTGVHRIRYSDNTIVTIPDDEIIYSTWGPFFF